MNNIKYGRGFTLIEVMIVVVILGILASIAYPSYVEYVQRSNRAEGKAALATAAAQFERCFTRTNTYVGCDVTVGATENGLYNITLDPVPTATTYRILATQLFGDGECGNLSLQHNGTRGSNNNAICW